MYGTHVERGKPIMLLLAGKDIVREPDAWSAQDEGESESYPVMG